MPHILILHSGPHYRPDTGILLRTMSVQSILRVQLHSRPPLVVGSDWPNAQIRTSASDWPLGHIWYIRPLIGGTSGWHPQWGCHSSGRLDYATMPAIMYTISRVCRSRQPSRVAFYPRRLLFCSVRFRLSFMVHSLVIRLSCLPPDVGCCRSFGLIAYYGHILYLLCLSTVRFTPSRAAPGLVAGLYPVHPTLVRLCVYISLQTTFI